MAKRGLKSDPLAWVKDTSKDSSEGENNKKKNTQKRGKNTTTVKQIQSNDTDTRVDNTIVKEEFCQIEKAISDRLARFQTLSEQAVYNRLYRLSHGECKDTVTVGMTALKRATGIKSLKTVAKALSGLTNKGHITVESKSGNDPTKGTTYRVFLSKEIL